jgi:diguanylate cyclase (GGDEF)-like protein
LQILAATTTMGLIGPTCARNYPAPRLACLHVCLCYLPFVTGSILSGEKWLLIMAVQTPMFLYGAMRIVLTYQILAVTTLQAEQDTRNRARHDPLTGLLNRLGCDDALVRYTMAGQASFVVMCLDLDGFKQVNDTLGHHAGDALLQAVARRLETRVRPDDAVVRLGGDEFMILAADMRPGKAEEFAERIIDVVAGEPYLLEGMQLVRIGVSIGFACAPDDGTEFEPLHRRADEALYAAKAAGKGVQRRFRAAQADAAQADAAQTYATLARAASAPGGEQAAPDQVTAESRNAA